MTRRPEVWLRGAVEGIPPLLQPVAHSLLQCREEVRETLPRVTREQLVARPQGAASVAYHLRHAIGSLDRLFTYARGAQLDGEQLQALKAEAAVEHEATDAADLTAAFEVAIDHALRQLRDTDPSRLLDAREVGRARLPSTVVGLLFHAAEHTQRHVGQSITTAKIVSGGPQDQRRAGASTS